MSLAALIAQANAADDAFEAACRKEGWKSRWDMNVTPQHSQFLRDAYFAKRAADKAVHEAFVAASDQVMIALDRVNG